MHHLRKCLLTQACSKPVLFPALRKVSVPEEYRTRYNELPNMSWHELETRGDYALLTSELPHRCRQHSTDQNHEG